MLTVIMNSVVWKTEKLILLNSETPAGYLPTKENGTNWWWKDSNDSYVTVKINGKDDMSLDTAF